MITELGGAVAVPIAVRSSDSTTTMRVNDVIMIRIDGAIDSTVSSAISWIARSVTPPRPAAEIDADVLRVRRDRRARPRRSGDRRDKNSTREGRQPHEDGFGRPSSEAISSSRFSKLVFSGAGRCRRRRRGRRLAACGAQPQNSRPPSVLKRHPVLIGSIIGFVGGFSVGLALGGRIADWSSELAGVVIGGIGAGAGAIVGDSRSENVEGCEHNSYLARTPITRLPNYPIS